MTQWDESFDFVIVGSGGGGMVAAMAAVEAGLAPVVLEKQERLGGSTAMSGGVIWMPNNPLMRAAGVSDSYEDGLAYLDAVVGDVGPASSQERREMFLTAGSAMITFLQEQGISLVRCAGYSDYYPNAKGASAAGRSIEPLPFDAMELGEWHDRIQPGQSQRYGLVFMTNESRSIQYYNRTLRTFAISARVWFRTVLSRLRKQELLANGSALIARMTQALLRMGVPLWRNSSIQDLIVEDGRVVGVRAVRDGHELLLEARKGVLIAAGGFGHNAEMRKRYSGNQPNEAQWSAANPGDTGEALEAMMRLGAKTDLLDEAWWLPAPSPGLARSTLGMARQRPRAIFVDTAGERFCNESNSYVEVGQAMYARGAVPCWLIFDDLYRRRYASAKSLPGRLPREWIDSGLVKKANTIEQLADEIGVDAKGLSATIRRFNVNAKFGADPDFGRGQSAYNRCMGDPAHKPNAALGPIEKAPFYATAIYPADVGTCGGVITTEYGEVVAQDGSVIPGLYAAGNVTATVTGRMYPGAGGSIANTMVFGYVAARHAAGRQPADVK
jgi:3-oxosteroid 1-dehydrogenase